MRDSGGNLHLYAVGNNNWSNGIRVWRFTESYPGSKTGSWGSKYGTFFSDPPGYGYYMAGNASSVWGSGPNDVYVVGKRDERGRVYRYDGSSWTRITDFGDIATACCVWGTGPNDVWVSTVDGRLLHYGPITIDATVDIDPDTLNLKSKGKWITAYIELPPGYDVGDIDVGTILLNETVPAEASPVEIGDHDADGIPDLMVKFSRSQVQGILSPGEAIKITVTGAAEEVYFEGVDTIRVI